MLENKEIKHLETPNCTEKKKYLFEKVIIPKRDSDGVLLFPSEDNEDWEL